MKNDYRLLDSGNGRRLEQFGEVVLSRPCQQALWRQAHPGLWSGAVAEFDRKDGMKWEGRDRIPGSWVITVAGVRMKLSATDFGHVGVFPETFPMWTWIRNAVSSRGGGKGGARFLNLFAYSGGATLAALMGGATCCHLDSSRGMVERARENAALNGLTDAPVRWIVDDATKFLEREKRRRSVYDAVLLDPPSFGRGKRDVVYKIERDLQGTLERVKAVLSTSPLFVVCTSHTPGMTPVVMRNMFSQVFGRERLSAGELLIRGGTGTLPLPSGTWVSWTPSDVKLPPISGREGGTHA